MPPNAKQDRIFLDLARGHGALDAKAAEALKAQAQREGKSLLEAATSSPSFPKPALEQLRRELDGLAFTCKKCGQRDIASPSEQGRDTCETCTPMARSSRRLARAGLGSSPDSPALEPPKKGSSGSIPVVASDGPLEPRRPGSGVSRPTGRLSGSSSGSIKLPPGALSSQGSGETTPVPSPGVAPRRQTGRLVAPSSPASQRLQSPPPSGGALEPPRKKTLSLGARDSGPLQALSPSSTPKPGPSPAPPADDGIFLTHMAEAPAAPKPAAPPPLEEHRDGEVFLTQLGGDGDKPHVSVSATPTPHGQADIFLNEVGGKPEENKAGEPPAPNAPVRGATQRRSPVSQRRTNIFDGSLGMADAGEKSRLAADPSAKTMIALDSEVDMAGAVIGGCKIERLLGKGGMARVYLAHHAGLDRKMAIKILDEKLMSKPGFAEQFLVEARTLAKLDHPNIVRVFNVDKDQSGANFIVMELLDGGSVEAYWKKNKQAPIDEAVRIIREAAEGLFHAHRAGLIHRDVKPANLMLTKDKRVKVVDFGLAVPTTGDAFVATGLAGTPVYMAPEQADGLRIDARCDQYALGVTLYQLLCGRPPFEGKRSVDVLLAHATQPPPPPKELRPDIPPWLEKGLLTMLAKQPAARFPSLGEVIRLLQGQKVAIGELPPPVPARPIVRVEDISNLEKGLAPKDVAPPRWRPALLAVASCAAVLAVFFVGPGRAAFGKTEFSTDSPAIAKVKKQVDALAAGGKPSDLVAALKRLEDEIADLGARAKAAVLETERKSLQERIEEKRKTTAKELREKAAELTGSGRFAAAIELADPEDKSLVALDLVAVAVELRNDATKGLATTRNEVYLRGGAYLAGTGAGTRAELKGFYIERTEVTNEAWSKVVGKEGLTAPPHWPQGQMPPAIAKQPVVNVTYDEAARYAKAVSKRLPSSEEWERAARGDKDARAYPWGDRFEASRSHLLGSGPDGLEDVDARPNDVSPDGVLGLAGNAMEWVTSGRGPLLAGGGFRSNEKSARVFSRLAIAGDTRDPGVGFRCARDLEPAEGGKK